MFFNVLLRRNPLFIKVYKSDIAIFFSRLVAFTFEFIIEAQGGVEIIDDRDVLMEAGGMLFPFMFPQGAVAFWCGAFITAWPIFV
jgi:hypothetical protein